MERKNTPLIFDAQPLITLWGEHPQSNEEPTLVKALSKPPLPSKVNTVTNIFWSTQDNRSSLLNSMLLSRFPRSIAYSLTTDKK